MVLKQPNLSNSSDSFLGPESDHSSFLKSTETSFVAFPAKRRRSIRRSDYDSLLLSESKRISTYSSLLQSSEVKQFSPDVLQSLQIQPKLTDLSLSSISGSRMDSTLQESDTTIHEMKEKSPERKEEEKEEEKNSMEEVSIGMDDVVLPVNESNEGESVQSSIEISSAKQSEVKQSKANESTESVEQRKEEEEPEEESEEEESEEEKPEEKEEEEPEEEEEQEKEEEPEEEEKEEEEPEEEEKEEEPEEEEKEEEEKEEEPTEESQHSVESVESVSLGDIPFANSQEERTLRELLVPSQPSQLGDMTSLLEPSLMPPPSSSLASRLRIPNRTKIHTHRKSSELVPLF